MEINLVVVSKLASECIAVDKITIQNINNPILAELFDATYDKYPSLTKFEDYRLFWRYAKSTFLEIFDYLSYVTALRLTVDMNVYLMLNDFGDNWDDIDNISYLERLDELEDNERKERERDIYDVKIIRERVDAETVEEVERQKRAPRTDEEVLCFAVRNAPELRYYTADLERRFAMIDDLSKGWPNKNDQLITTPPEIVFEKRTQKSEKKGKNKGKKGNEQKGKKGKDKKKGSKKK